MKKAFWIFSFLFLSIITTNGAIVLPKIFTSNMVVQRETPLNIWGWGEKGEMVSVTFNGKSSSVKTSGDGTWMITLPSMQAGGPFEMKITGKSNSVLLSNILIGDVWICSGQSNMEWVLKNTNDAGKEMANANYPAIRLFTVDKAISFTPKQDLPGGQWLECDSKNIGDFSAVAYFFGRKLNKDLNVPIGLINSSWGGTNIQTWISWDVMSRDPQYKKFDATAFRKMNKNQTEIQQQYAAALKVDKGITEKWYDPSTTIEGWKKIAVPGLWEQTEIGNTDGIIWFRKEFDVPASLADKNATLSLGAIDDADETYVNGTLIGKENDYSRARLYTLDNILKPGKNYVVIKVTDNQGGGGLYGKPEQLYVDVAGTKVSLAGEWHYKPSVLSSAFGVVNMGPNEFPSQLYNSMIAPIIKFKMKGVIWYQGESNTYEAFKYRALFSNLINDWRDKWGYEFPFYWVQLANFMAPVSQPAPSEWAELREAQNRTLSLPKTGQAVIIDIGEEKDIHPRNKQDVGYRLALAALKTTYDKDIVYAGPIYSTMKTDGNKVTLSFTSEGTGLIAKGDKYGYLKGFSIAGLDKKFVWAKAYIDGNQVVVYSDEVASPVAVRYAWADNPDDANLFNKEGLPASPFRTDDWKLTTEK